MYSICLRSNTCARRKGRDTKVETDALPQLCKPEEKSKRTSSLRFACPSRLMSGGGSATKRPPLSQSPAPVIRAQQPDVSARAHRGSEATLTDAKAATDSENHRKDLSQYSIADTDRLGTSRSKRRRRERRETGTQS